jgi:hypothetical protein
MFKMAHMFSSFFLCFESVSDTCCKCFECLGHMLQVFLSGCYKNRYDITHVGMEPTRRSRWPQLLGHRQASPGRCLGQVNTSIGEVTRTHVAFPRARVSSSLVEQTEHRAGSNVGIHMVGRAKIGSAGSGPYSCGTVGC